MRNMQSVTRSGQEERIHTPAILDSYPIRWEPAPIKGFEQATLDFEAGHEQATTAAKPVTAGGAQ